jgi:hypothetical protein
MRPIDTRVPLGFRRQPQNRRQIAAPGRCPGPRRSLIKGNFRRRVPVAPEFHCIQAVSYPEEKFDAV